MDNKNNRNKQSSNKETALDVGGWIDTYFSNLNLQRIKKDTMPLGFILSNFLPQLLVQINMQLSPTFVLSFV